jgi:hypothetical protein
MSEALGTTHGRGMTPAEYEEHAIISGVHGKKVFIVNPDGSQAIVSNPFSGYGLYAVDSEDATYFYAMYQNTSAAWIVIRITLATGITLYATGSSDASTNWTGRAGLTYQDYNTTF